MFFLLCSLTRVLTPLCRAHCPQREGLGIGTEIAPLLQLTPPLGWLSWQRYRCAIACNDATSPDCFNEKLIRDTADEMVAGGYLAAGYNYLNLDDVRRSSLPC